MRTIVVVLLALISIGFAARRTEAAWGLCSCSDDFGNVISAECTENAALCRARCGWVFHMDFKSPYPGCYAPPPKQYNRASLKQHVKWAIFHEGCTVYAGNNLDTIDNWRACYLRMETHNDEATYQIKNAPAKDLREVTLESANEIPGEFQVTQNFQWVCDHEEQGAAIHRMRDAGDFAGIRRLYGSKQEHNPNARNILAALSDEQLSQLVSSSCPAKEHTQRERHERPDHPDKP